MADPLSIGVQLALTAASMAITASQSHEGPRLDDVRFNGGDPGALLQRVWGARWIAPPACYGEELEEVKRRRKTKGGKYNEYTYFGTWSVMLTCHEISAVRRIKFDGHLVYDVSGAGPVTPFEFGGTGTLNDYISIYLGTDDQMPDPHMEAAIEARYGEGACPAYRGRGRIDFKRIPLEKFGNRIPQVTVEVIGIAEPAYPYERVSGVVGIDDSRLFTPDFSLMLSSIGPSDVYGVYDAAARAQAYSGGTQLENCAVTETGFIGTYGGDLYVQEFGGGRVLIQEDVSGIPFWLVDGAGREHIFMTPGFMNGSFLFDGAYVDPVDISGELFDARFAFTDDDGNVWIGGAKWAVSQTEMLFQRMVTVLDNGPATVIVSGLTGKSGFDHDAGFGFRDSDATGYFVFRWGSKLYSAVIATGVVHAVNTTLPTYSFMGAFTRNRPTGMRTFWAAMHELSLPDLTELRFADSQDWVPGLSTFLGIYDPINHALIVGDAPDFVWLYLDRVGSEGVMLRQIVEDVCELAGADLARIDASALVQTVEGYSVAGGSGKEWLERLLAVYDIDARPHGFDLQFVPRGDTASETIVSDSFAVASEGDAEPLFTSSRKGGTDIPSQVILQFADVDAEQQPNAASSGPLFEVDSERTLTLDMRTLALDVDAARQLVARYHRRLCFERLDRSLALPASQIALEPADLRYLELRGNVVAARLDSMVLGADRRIATEWRRDDPSVALLDGVAGAPFDGRRPSVIAVPLLSKGFVIDGPYVSDAQAQTTPIVNVMAAPTATGTWPGAVIYQETGGEYTEELAAVPSSSDATWGYIDDAAAYANPNLWDRATVLTVRIQNGDLAGTTEAAIDANPLANLAAYGGPGRWEYLNFAQADLVSAGVYEISGLKRGRRGTEWAMELHQDSDQFVLLDTTQAVGLGLSEVGTDQSFKAITSSRTTGLPINLEPFTGASLKPYAPCHLEAVKEDNGDWTISWVRRTRVGGAWTSGTSIPLAEVSEEYELVLGDGVDEVTKVVASATTYTWLQADQIADVGAEVMAGDLAFTIYQMSDAVGRGFAAAAAA